MKHNPRRREVQGTLGLLSPSIPTPSEHQANKEFYETLHKSTHNSFPRFESSHQTMEDSILHTHVGQDPHRQGTAKIAVQNFDGRLVDSIQQHRNHMKAHKIDILAGIHTGGTEASIAFAIRNARINDPHFYYSFTPIPPKPIESLNSKRTKDDRIGGIIIMAAKEWKDSIYGYTADQSSLGILARFNIHLIGVPDITVIVAYIPQYHKIDTDDPINRNKQHHDSLYAHTQHYVNKARQKQLLPYEYIAEVTGAWVSNAQDKNHNVILLGDFNSYWTDKINISEAPIPPNLKAWATAMNLIHPAYKQRRQRGDTLPPTYHKDNQYDTTKSIHTTPDHILVSPDLEHTITESGTCTCVGSHMLSDHNPTWITLDIPRKEQIQGTKIQNHLPIELNIDDPQQTELYVTQLNSTYPEDTEFPPITSNTQAEAELLQILTNSTISTVKARGMRTQKATVFWTPFMKAHHEHYNTLLEIKANLTGGKKTRKWTHITYEPGLLKIIDQWETNHSTIMKNFTAEEKEETLHIKDNTDKKRKCLTPAE
jgi:hypothetical protein